MRNFILILVILLFAGCNKSDKNIDVEKKYNIRRRCQEGDFLFIGI